MSIQILGEIIEIFICFAQENLATFCYAMFAGVNWNNVHVATSVAAATKVSELFHIVAVLCCIDTLLARNVMRCLIKSTAIADIASLSLSSSSCLDGHPLTLLYYRG